MHETALCPVAIAEIIAYLDRELDDAIRHAGSQQWLADLGGAARANLEDSCGTQCERSL